MTIFEKSPISRLLVINFNKSGGIIAHNFGKYVYLAQEKFEWSHTKQLCVIALQMEDPF